MAAAVSHEFLAVQTGDLVVVEEDSALSKKNDPDWWLGHVIHIIGGARTPCKNSLFQVANVDTGVIKTINADLVKRILLPKDLNP